MWTGLIWLNERDQLWDHVKIVMNKARRLLVFHEEPFSGFYYTILAIKVSLACSVFHKRWTISDFKTGGINGSKIYRKL